MTRPADGQLQPVGLPRQDLAAATVGIEPVPPRFRVLGFIDYAVLWADLGVGLLVLLAGSLLAPGLGFLPACAAIILGTLAGTLLLALAGTVGSDHGIPSMVTLRPSFGIRGSYLPSLVNAIQLVGWAAFELNIMGRASEEITAPFVGQGSYPLWVLLWGALVVAMALGGPLVVIRQWLEKAGIWIVLGTVSWIAFWVVTHQDVAAAVARPGDGSLTFAQGVDLVVAMPVSWLPLVADYNRFARRSSSAFWGTFLGFAMANAAFYALGALLVLVLPTGDLISAILSVAFGAAGLALLLGDETDNAFADVYSTAISLKNVVPAWPTSWLVVGAGASALVIALTVDLTRYQGFLYLIGSLFTPLFGVLFADYFLLRRRKYDAASLYGEASRRGGRRGEGTADGDRAVEVAPDGDRRDEDGPQRGRPHGGSPAFALAAWLGGALVYLAVVSALPWLGGTLPSLAASLVLYLVFRGLQALVVDRHRAR
jgi:putative hydroxymethylpyrimidine transporter CytX